MKKVIFFLICLIGQLGFSQILITSTQIIDGDLTFGDRSPNDNTFIKFQEVDNSIQIRIAAFYDDQGIENDFIQDAFLSYLGLDGNYETIVSVHNSEISQYVSNSLYTDSEGGVTIYADINEDNEEQTILGDGENGENGTFKYNILENVDNGTDRTYGHLEYNGFDNYYGGNWYYMEFNWLPPAHLVDKNVAFRLDFTFQSNFNEDVNPGYFELSDHYGGYGNIYKDLREEKIVEYNPTVNGQVSVQSSRISSDYYIHVEEIPEGDPFACDNDNAYRIIKRMHLNIRYTSTTIRFRNKFRMTII